MAQLPLTVQIVASNELRDFGTLSARSVTTDRNGRARFSYTAPLVSTNPAGQADPGTEVAIRVTPRTENHANALARSVVIRLVPPGRVLPAFRVEAGFTFEPNPAMAREATLFSARYCDAAQDSPPVCVDDPGRLATRFTWSFGDGAQAAGQTVSHVFDAAGAYPVRLAVADAFRRSASRTRSVRVEAGAGPEPAFDVSPSLPIAAAPVVFDAGRTTSSRPIAAYEWSLGDGATGSGRVLTHRYARAGAYAVTLTVTDDRGGAATAAREVTVASGEPTAVIDVSPQRPAVGQPVSFSGLRSAARPGRTIVAHAWMLGDAGATAQGGSVTHTYGSAGTYVVTLVVTDDFGASATASVTVSVGEVPAAARSPPRAGRVTLGQMGVETGLAPAARLDARLRAVRGELARLGLEALVVTHLPHLFYLANIRSSAGMLVVTPTDAQLLIDFRYRTVVSEALASGVGPSGLRRVDVDGSYEEALRRVAREAGWERMGVEADHLSVRRWQWLEGSLPAALAATVGLVERIRMRKDDDEVATLRAAGDLLAPVAARVLDSVAVGRSERELAARIEQALRDGGFERPAFDSIVAGGPNSALPHAQPTGRRLAAGDLVLLDFGGVHHGYCVDLSRTVCVGRAGTEAQRLHQAVLAAQAAALAAIRPGIRASAVDAAAREVLAGLGLAEAFGHSTGHGLGIELHEAPRIGRPRVDGEAAAADTEDPLLSPGMVFTVEPGVYVPEVGGVRIEDDVLVTEDGYEMLTRVPNDLRVC
ncbi:MAG: M24 family metallopeptidase [Acidobacteria bacterium]|nr:M24 family metallopeptidase [Acidobacteriota bacterium]